MRYLFQFASPVCVSPPKIRRGMAVFLRLCTFIGVSGALSCPASAWAQTPQETAVQETTAQEHGSDGQRFAENEVIQALPPAELMQLKTALAVLARNPRDVNALTDAGQASLAVHDTDAAIGFLGRAQDLSPQNPRVLLGLADAYIQARNPLRAFGLYTAAESAGAPAMQIARGRGLAYDLVGQNNAAQAEYRRALALGEDAETRRRLAVSYAISGDRDAYQQTIAPLQSIGDRASSRTRVFAMVILGDNESALAIAQGSMPPHLLNKLSPYLQFMGRLTPAQQAAAANLGAFPRAAQIGRDTQQIIAYREQNPEKLVSQTVTTAKTVQEKPDSRLAKTKKKGGTKQPGRKKTERSGRTKLVPTPVNPALEKDVVPIENASKDTPQANTRLASAQPDAPPAQATPTRQRQTSAPDMAASPKAAAPKNLVQPKTAQSDAQKIQASATPAVKPAADTQVVTKVQGAEAVDTKPAITPTASKPSVADAFAGVNAPPASYTGQHSRGVDISRITPPREVAPKRENTAAASEPKQDRSDQSAKDEHPSRYWVQLATGKDRDALKYDWRRFSRKAPDVLGDIKAHVTPWGQANRLLAGPYKTRKESGMALKELAKIGIDGFLYTSPKGEQIDLLE